MILPKNLKTVISLLIFLFFIISFNTNAQDRNCSENYRSALEFYNLGMADSALNILTPCLENKKLSKEVSRETCVNIYRLAALASIMTEQPAKAEEFVQQLLKYEPDYKNNIRENDLQEFRLMLDKSFAQPELKISVKTGANYSLIKLQKYYFDYEKQGGDNSMNGGLGFQFGIEGEKAFTKSLSLGAGVGLTNLSFKYTASRTWNEKYKFDQNITFLEFPVFIKYSFVSNRSIDPYFQAGLNVKFMISGSNKSDTYGRYWLTKSSNSDNILATFITDMENFGFLIGGGFDYKLNNSSIRLDLRYIHILGSETRYSKFDGIDLYEDFPASTKIYSNDISLMNLKNLQISVGFVYNLKYKVF